MYRKIIVKTPGATLVCRAEYILPSDLRRIGATEEQIDTYIDTDPLHIYKHDGLYHVRGCYEEDFLSAEGLLDFLQCVCEAEPDPHYSPDDL